MQKTTEWTTSSPRRDEKERVGTLDSERGGRRVACVAKEMSGAEGGQGDEEMKRKGTIALSPSAEEKLRWCPWVDSKSAYLKEARGYRKWKFIAAHKLYEIASPLNCVLSSSAATYIGQVRYYSIDASIIALFVAPQTISLLNYLQPNDKRNSWFQLTDSSTLINSTVARTRRKVRSRAVKCSMQ